MLQIRRLHLGSGRQIVWQVSSQSPVTVGLNHEVHYCVVCVYTEARTVLRALVTNFFFTCSCSGIRSCNRIRHLPGCVYNQAQNFRLEAF
jgi:hypothetical protein